MQTMLVKLLLPNFLVQGDQIPLTWQIQLKPAFVRRCLKRVTLFFFFFFFFFLIKNKQNYHNSWTGFWNIPSQSLETASPTQPGGYHDSAAVHPLLPAN
jgi:hypothetical protein